MINPDYFLFIPIRIKFWLNNFYFFIILLQQYFLIYFQIPFLSEILLEQIIHS